MNTPTQKGFGIALSCIIPVFVCGQIAAKSNGAAPEEQISSSSFLIEAQQAQPVLFNLQDDERPKSQRTAAARYEEPTLF